MSGNDGNAGSTATPLTDRLTARIARDGPMSVADYMQACLHDPEYGYYRGQTAIGQTGDFITAPEINQIFGELIGLWCVLVWQNMGSPSKLRLIEIGPGRGTLMRDALRAARLVPEFRAALSVELVESNGVLQAAQRETLAGESVPLSWGGELIPGNAPVILIGNEFLDTLPIDQWIWRDGAWRMRAVGLNQEGALTFVEMEDGSTALPSVPPDLVPEEGCIFESRGRPFAELITAIKKLGAPVAGLLIDYGHTRSGFGDTLQAIDAHRYADPLQSPGKADLSAQVDFAALADAARAEGLAVDGPVTQAELLGRLGTIERASRLMAMNPTLAAGIEASVARLLAPGGMGTRFHAVGIRSVDISPLPALEPVETDRRAT